MICYFLDRVTTKTLELEHTRAAVFSGPYSVFKRKKQEQRDAQMKHYLQQQKEIKRIEDFVANQRRWNRERNIIAAESRLKALDRMVKLEKPKEAGQSAVLCLSDRRQAKQRRAFGARRQQNVRQRAAADRRQL